MKCKSDNEGMIMIETLWVLIVTSLLFFFIFCIAFIYYQQWTIKIIADETAAKIAQTYKNPDASMNGVSSKNTIINIDPYRYFNMIDIHSGTVKSNLLESKNKTKAKNYIRERFDKAFITTIYSQPQVDLKLKRDSLSRNHITVNIKGTYQVPFQTLFAYAGIGNVISYDIDGNAECIDLIDYLNTIDYVDNISSLSVLNSSIIKAVNSVLKLLNHLTKLGG